MRRITIPAVAAALLAFACVAGSAFGFAANFDYLGQVKNDPDSNVGFKIKRTSSGHKRVTQFTVTNVPITCSDSVATRSTDGYELDDAMRVKHRAFAGSGNWTVLLLDPSGSVTGTLRPGGTATGTFRLHGELAGMGTHCHTGPLDWKATKVA